MHSNLWFTSMSSFEFEWQYLLDGCSHVSFLFKETFLLLWDSQSNLHWAATIKKGRNKTLIGYKIINLIIHKYIQ